MTSDTPDTLYPYRPSKPAGVAAAIIFAIILIIHVVRLFKSRAWFCIPLVIGGIFEVLGYAARVRSHDHPGEMNPFIIHTFLILLAPILFAATVYMFLGRIFRETGQHALAMIRPSLLTKVFVGGDIFCFLVQRVGAGILAKAKSSSALNLGKNTILGGLVLQILIFGFFVVVAAIFHKGMLRFVTGKRDARRESLNWHQFLLTLYAVSVFITLRNIFRVAEYVGGEDGYLLQKEWPLYGFDAVLMTIALVICIGWYVGGTVWESMRWPQDESFTMVPDPWARH